MARITFRVTGNEVAGGTADTFIERLRLGLTITIVSNALFALVDQVLAPAHLVPLFLLKLAQMVTAAGALGLLRLQTAREHAVSLTLAVVTVVCASIAAAGILTGDALTTPAICVFLALATATVLPWGAGPQLAVAAICGLAILSNAHHSLLGGFGTLVSYPAVLIAGGLGSSVYIAYGFNRVRQADQQTLAALRESEQTLGGIITNMQDVFYHNDLQGIVRMISPSVRQFGYEVDDLIGRDARTFLDDPADMERLRAAPVAYDSVTDFEIKIKRKDGTRAIVAASSHPLFDRDGRRVGFEGVLRDVTARKRAEAALEISERRYRRLFETAKDGIFILDADTGEINDANPFLLELLGRSLDEILGKRLWEVSPFKDVADNQEAFQRLQKSAYIRYEHLPLERKDGSRVDVEFVSNVYLVNGTRVIQCNVRDISARKQLEQQRADFIAMLAHDIRSPLSVIASYTDLALESGGVPSEVREFLSASERSVQTLLSLVANQLQHSQIEADQLTLLKQPLVVNELLERACRPWQAECARRHLTLELRLLPELPVMNGDPVALERVFANLVQNALKFTPDAGRITVQSRQEGPNVVVSVTDTGPGIAAEEVPNLFVRYRRMSAGRSREGSGLGLFIVKALVEAHGGSVEVASTLGTGSRFTVVLPTGPPT